jgi:hypothetical protein
MNVRMMIFLAIVVFNRRGGFMAKPGFSRSSTATAGSASTDWMIAPDMSIVKNESFRPSPGYGAFD